MIAALAAAQHDQVARRQLLELGFGRGAIDHRIERARMRATLRGVYTTRHGRLSREAWWTAAVLAAGSGAVLSHRAAAALHRLRPSAHLEVTVPGDRRLPRVVVHRALLPDDEITVVDGIPVTGISRTLLDLAAVVPAHHVERAARRAEIDRLADVLSLDELLRRHPGRRGARAIRSLVAERTASVLTRSELEDAFLEFARRHGLPAPQMNAVVEGFECDAIWPEQRLIVELDSRRFHMDVKAFEADRRRDRILQRAGWRVIRLTNEQLDADAAADLRAMAA